MTAPRVPTTNGDHTKAQKRLKARDQSNIHKGVQPDNTRVAKSKPVTSSDIGNAFSSGLRQSDYADKEARKISKDSSDVTNFKHNMAALDSGMAANKNLDRYDSLRTAKAKQDSAGAKAGKDILKLKPKP